MATLHIYEHYNVSIISMYETLGMTKEALKWLWIDVTDYQQGDY